ncbi:carbonic anhydrase [Candidatus Woesearchaeota archaeon]|nr:carbonic anhydrase [Candidatus Woesearchaeota archaeon]
MKDAKSLLNDLIEGNIGFSAREGDKLSDLQSGQSPFMTLVMCSDSRVSSAFCGMDTTNNFFIIRNIGNQVSTSPGSVDYGVLHLHTPILMILGHSGCGAVKASLSDYSEETAEIKAELDTLQGPVKDTKDVSDSGKRNCLCIQKNVDNQIAFCLDRYRKLVDEGKLVIIGAFYDFHNKMSDELGRFYVMNVNGKTDADSINALDIFEIGHFKRFEV